MELKSKAAHYMRVAARYLDDPQQFRMRRSYFLPAMYQALGKPWIQQMQVRTILDIGASEGNFAFTVRPLFPNAMIYSFEPLPGVYAALARNLAGVERFRAFNLGIGENDTEMTIHQSQHSPSSSFLEMGDLHKQAFPTSAAVAEEVKVKVARLDGLSDQLAIEEPLLVKIDVQGYELHVLRGGEQTIRRAQVIIIETSFQPLYEGGPLFADVFRFLTDWGFAYQGALDVLADPGSGANLQEDSVFVRRP